MPILLSTELPHHHIRLTMNPSSIIPALTSVAVATAFLTSCASTPQSRIASNPEIFNALSNSHKELISHGRITEGMTSQAVFLAWGKADFVKRSSSGGRLTETWVYNGVQPVYASSYGFGMGYGYGPYHRGYYDPYFCYGPTVYYQTYVVGKVTFRNGVVTQWEVSGR